jgi:peptidoglycan/xylan/chitin deacetylase (PgdA/CDA1 family)
MDVVLFDKCIRHISAKYKVMLIEDLVKSPLLNSGTDIATISFDDGYKDNLEFAAPILNKYSCKASFYVVTDCIDHNVPTWTHILEHLFQFTQVMSLNMAFDFIPDNLKKADFRDAKQRLDYAMKIKPYLKTLPHEQRNEAMDRIIETFSDTELPHVMMNWSDLKELISQGHYIGSHSVSHAMLGTMDNEEEIRYELVQSGNRIREELGYFPVSFSYPVGSYNDHVMRLSSEVGYELAMAVHQTVYDPSAFGVFEIPRIELYNEPWWKTRLRISNRLERFKEMIGYK